MKLVHVILHFFKVKIFYFFVPVDILKFEFHACKKFMSLCQLLIF